MLVVVARRRRFFFSLSTSCFPLSQKNNLILLLAEAETLHQRATRRHDDSSLELFEAAASAFRDALSGRGGNDNATSPFATDVADLWPLPPLKQASALFGLAEAFQGWASRLVERAEATPSEALTRANESLAAANATTLLAQAVGAYAAASGAAEQITAAGQQSDNDASAAAAAVTKATAKHLLSDAVVNAGNALCEWASLLSKAASWPAETRERFKFATSAEDATAGAAELLLASAPATAAEAATPLAAALPQPRASLLSAARALVSRAVEAYEGAAALPGADDANTRLNLADALVQAGELAIESSSSPSSSSSSAAAASLGEGRGFYLRSFKDFEEAVARASSEDGDDLPALLLNWGAGLHSAFTKLHGERGGERAPAGGGSPLSSPLSLLEAAEARLRETASFGRGDPSPLCALGDVLCDRAAMAAAQAAGSPSGGGENGGENGGGAAPAARVLYERAISEGYGAALAIDRRCAAASAGKGDALLALSRHAAAASGDAAVAAASSAELAKEAARAYSNALAEAPRLGGLDERGSVIYNAACASARAAALSGDERASPNAGGGGGGCGGGGGGVTVETAVEGARRRVRLLVAGGAVSAREVLMDEDLACLRGEQWLLDVASAEEAAERDGDAMRE